MPQKTTALIVVRTYPVPAKQGVEVSCTAAVTSDGRWLRLFPVPYRRLPQHQESTKYDVIEVEIIKASDPRPESHKIVPDTIKILDSVGTESEWRQRKDRTFPLKSEGMCAIQEQRDNYGAPTLGLFKPRIKRLVIEPADSPTWTEAQAAILGQLDLFDEEPLSELEKIPYDFRYDFTCGATGCNGHSMKCTDWEMLQSWRKWRDEYGLRVGEAVSAEVQNEK